MYDSFLQLIRCLIWSMIFSIAAIAFVFISIIRYSAFGAEWVWDHLRVILDRLAEKVKTSP